MVQLPLFPGYLFVRIDANRGTRDCVLRTNGVTSFVGARGMGTVIPDDEIKAVQAVIEKWDQHTGLRFVPGDPASLAPKDRVGLASSLRGRRNDPGYQMQSDLKDER